MAIKVILLLGLLALLVLCLLLVRSRLATRLFFIAQFLVGAVLVVNPDLATRAAQAVGVGRGTDLILYLLVLLVYAGGIVVLAKFRRLERQITELTRELALAKAPPPQ